MDATYAISKIEKYFIIFQIRRDLVNIFQYSDIKKSPLWKSYDDVSKSRNSA